ncbi:glycosyltransferase family 8 protein [bacterium]|nr:glycosyltransferase family 8 protein [bacterium]
MEKIFDKSVNIVFAADDNYSLCTIVALYSLISHTSKENNYDIVIFESGISEENKKIMTDLVLDYKNISLRFFNTKKFFEEYKFFNYSYYTPDTYARLYIPDVMKNHDKAIYLDCDIIVLDDIAKLYDYEFGNNIVAGNRNYGLIVHYYQKPDIKKYYDELYPIKNIENSVNSGVLLMNLEELRKINLAKQGQELLNKYKRLLCQDEDILNKVCEGRVGFIGSEWNWRFAVPEPLIYDYRLIKFAQEWAKGLYSQKIIHYICRTKPWDEPNMYYADIWWAWAKKSPVYQILLKNYFEKHPEMLNKS